MTLETTPTVNSPRPSALDFSEVQWKAWCVEAGAKAFAAAQIMQWIFVKGVLDPRSYTNLAPALRERLAAAFDWSLPYVDTRLPSSDASEKILWKTREGLFAECVLMPSENRVTLCVSSQVGCRMACTFCQTGRMGLSRNLTRGEILAQLLMANARLSELGETRKVTNVVFMGMGEPLDNYDEVVAACGVMIDERFFGLSKHRVTVSTSGLVPEIERLGADLPVALAISLHSADDEQRSSMMPVNRRYPLAELKRALLAYPAHTRHGITFEYVMIAGKNDTLAHAKKLVKFVHGLKAKVNLIPLNPHPGSGMESTDPDAMRAFQKYLGDRSIPAPVRYSRGQDVSGACGQLAAKRGEELNLPPRLTALARRREYLAQKNSQD
jgi:23S rRNA (adenine2503-C2)-methyltransferase